MGEIATMPIVQGVGTEPVKPIHALIVAGLVLTGCEGLLFDSPEVAQCEKYILAKIQKPDTYKRGEYASLIIPAVPKYWQVAIEYTFVDDSGATVETHQICDFPLAGGKADTSKYIDFDRENVE